MKQRFLTGLIILLPVALTIWLIALFVRIATQPFQAIARSWLTTLGAFQNGGILWLSEAQTVSVVSTMLILAALFLFVCCVGIVGEWFFVRWFVAAFDRILLAMPFVRKIYKSSKEFTNVLFTGDQKRFSQLVWVPFPSSQQRALGIVTNEFILPSHGNKEYVSVLIPGTPNPTVGFLLFFQKEDVQMTDIPIEEGMKWNISCGTSQQIPHLTSSSIQ